MTGKRTAIFGGSFNPIHNGHISIARALLAGGLADEVWFVVSPMNPFKQHAFLLDDSTRLRIARQAVAAEQGMHVSDVEFGLPRPSYMSNTLRTLSRRYPGRTFSLVIGGDNWQSFGKWHEAGFILSHYDVIVYPRSGNTDTQTAWAEGTESKNHSVTFVDMPLLNISSTDIRRRIKARQSIHGMVPADVEKEITEQYSNEGVSKYKSTT